MFRRIVHWSLRYRFIVLAMSVALIIVGADQMRDSRVDVFPEFAPPIVEIQTPCLGLAPTEVEALVKERALAVISRRMRQPRSQPSWLRIESKVVVTEPDWRGSARETQPASRGSPRSANAVGSGTPPATSDPAKLPIGQPRR